MLRPKNCKKCGGKMQIGGFASGPYAMNNQAAIDAANVEAKRFAVARGLVSGENTHVGNQVPKYIDAATGKPALPMATKPKATSIPSDATLQSGQGLFWYEDPQTGDVVDVDPMIGLRDPRFRKSQEVMNTDLTNRQQSVPSLAMKMKGGKLQKGGNYGYINMNSIYQNPLDEFNQPINENEIMYPNMDTSSSVNTSYVNRLQEGINKGIIQGPQGYQSSQDWYNYMQSSPEKETENGNPFVNLQNIGIGLRGARTGMGLLSGMIERGRQNQYDYEQQTALGQMNPMSATDYQPNPYSLYAKYGGSLKKYQKEMKYGGLNNVNYFGPPFSNGAKMNMGDNEKIDKMVVTRMVIPKLFGMSPYRNNKFYMSKREN